MAINEGLIGPAENIVTATAGITAEIMMAISSAMPTAVMTESSKKTMSSAAI
jgi:hypothetical protein